MSKPTKSSTATYTQNMSVADFIAFLTDRSGKTQTEIAKALGYPNPNIITMFKQGRTKVPVTKVIELANVLETDPLHLLRKVMTEYAPDTWNVLERVLGGNVVTDSEMKIVKIVREEAGDLAVCPKNEEQQNDLKELVKTWKPHLGPIVRHS